MNDSPSPNPRHNPSPNLSSEVLSDKEYHRRMLYLNLAIGNAKKASPPDYMLIEALANERETLNETYNAQRLAQREAALSESIKNALAFAPIIHERVSSLNYARTPLSHQLEGAVQLASAGSGMLADEPRLGKTFSSHIWADLLQTKKVLIFTPRDVQTTFLDQYSRDSNDRVIAKLGQLTAPQRTATLATIVQLDKSTGSGFIVVSNYESIRRDPNFIRQLKDIHFDTLILDESHNVNKTSTATFKAIQAIRYPRDWCPRHHNTFTSTFKATPASFPECGDCHDSNPTTKHYLEGSIEHVLCMTGTPILNYPPELFSQLHLIDRVSFPYERNFLFDYCSKVNGRWRWRYGAEKILAEKLGPRLVQRKAHDTGIDIPPQDIVIHEIGFDSARYPDQARVLHEIEKYAAIAFEGLFEDGGDIMSVPSLLAEITRMRQAVAWPGGIGMPCGMCADCLHVPSPRTCRNKRRVNVQESQKLDEAEQFILETCCGTDARLIVFSQFSDQGPLPELHKRLSSLNQLKVAPLYTGATPEFVRESIRRDFRFDSPNRNNPRWNILLANSKSGGTGIDLAGADFAVVLDEEWNPGKAEQRNHRIINMEKKTATAVHIFRQLDSVDEWMANLIAQKSELVSGFEAARSIIDRLSRKVLGYV